MRKRIVPPIECEFSFSTGTFLNNYDITDRKLKPLLTYSTVGKREKWELVETTFKQENIFVNKLKLLDWLNVYIYIIQSKMQRKPTNLITTNAMNVARIESQHNLFWHSYSLNVIYCNEMHDS